MYKTLHAAFGTGLIAFGGLIFGSSAAEAFDVVRDGHALAVIATAEHPGPVAAYAASELALHVEKVSGARLPVMPESQVPAGAVCIYIGDTEATRKAGIDVGKLGRETFVLRSSAKALCIAGLDDNGDPLDTDTSAGTLFGVYEWLERDLGVRWLWPGDLGTFAPVRATITVNPVDETVAPRLQQRNVRPGLSFTSAHPALGFTPAAAAAYAKDQTVFLRRNRIGRSYPMTYHHAYVDWWEKYGAEHPEWFQLVDGKRGPVHPRDRFSMCVSNPDLQRKVVDLWREQGGAVVHGRPSYINAVENDFLGSCECEACQAWDGPQPPDRDAFYPENFKVHGARYVSGRYARFALAVQQLAAKENPDAAVIIYAYFNYFQAPADVKLNPHVVIGYCPSAGWYPRADDENAWYQKQWKGWVDTGAREFVRTNYFLDGYCMPFIFAHQFAEDFQFEYRNGMFATDFDSLTGQWATQGPNLYLLLRLQVTPDAPIDSLLAEYYSCFGPAADAVKAYFDYWENYTMNHRQLVTDVFADRVAIRWRSWAKASHRVFPPDCFVPAETLLARARDAASADPAATARIEFLRTGLEHARLCNEVAALLTTADPASTAERGRQALENLLRFRRAHEREWFANLNHEAWVEDVSWKLSEETRQEPEYYP